MNIKLFPRWSWQDNNFISWLKVFFSSNPNLTDLYLLRVWISLMASGWKIPSEETATGQKLTPSLAYLVYFYWGETKQSYNQFGTQRILGWEEEKIRRGPSSIWSNFPSKPWECKHCWCWLLIRLQITRGQAADWNLIITKQPAQQQQIFFRNETNIFGLQTSTPDKDWYLLFSWVRLSSQLSGYQRVNMLFWWRVCFYNTTLHHTLTVPAVWVVTC